MQKCADLVDQVTVTADMADNSLTGTYSSSLPVPKRRGLQHCWADDSFSGQFGLVWSANSQQSARHSSTERQNHRGQSRPAYGYSYFHVWTACSETVTFNGSLIEV
jgi:hypothetical protein